MRELRRGAEGGLLEDQWAYAVYTDGADDDAVYAEPEGPHFNVSVGFDSAYLVSCKVHVISKYNGVEQ